MVAEKLEKSKFLLYIVSLIKQNIFVFNQHEFLWNHIFILPFKVYIYIYIYIYKYIYIYTYIYCADKLQTSIWE